MDKLLKNTGVLGWFCSLLQGNSNSTGFTDFNPPTIIKFGTFSLFKCSDYCECNN